MEGSTTNGRVNIEASGEASLVNISTDKELHINSGSADDFTVGINCTDGAKVSLTGKEGILMNQNTTVKVEGSGSTLMTSGDVTATASAITIGEGSTWDATGKITLKGTTLNNTGTLTATQLELSGGSIFDNSGKLSGSLTAVNGAKITGSGTFGSLVVKNGSTLVVGNSPGLQTVESLTIDSGSTTIFSVAGLELTDVATADTKGWDSGKYSSITMGESATLTIENGAVFAITFGGDKIFDPEQLSSESASLTKQFTLQLITGAGELTEETLTSLLQNTEFSITDESAGIPTAGNWEIDVTDAQYKIENNNLYLSGTMNARLVPEPTTATLSLLALAGLAARRRRR